MTAWYEFEELVGWRWHRWAASATSYPTFPEAEVRLDSLRDTLAVYFRAHGGGRSLTLTCAAAIDSSHRLTLRQRLGLQQEPHEPARRDSDNVVLPARLACFPDRSLNRDLYFWLTGFLAEVQPAEPADDPLQRDLLELRAAVQATQSLGKRFPGLNKRYVHLCQELRQLRPERRLPPVEAQLESVILHLLGHEESLTPASQQLLNGIHGSGPIETLRAPRGYRPPLPVPVWGQALNLSPSSVPVDESDPDPGVDASPSDDVRRAAERRHLDQTERDDPLMLNPFEKMLSWSEMVNVNRAVEDDEEDDARQAADQLEQLTLTQHKRQAATRLRMDLEIAAEDVDESRIEAALTYPEWHYRKQRYLPDYCAVFAEPAAEVTAGLKPPWEPDEQTRQRIRKIRRQFEALRPRRELLRRQIDGDELDLDAMISSIAERAAGGQGSENIYMSWREQARDLAVATLVDVSLSTDSWIDDRRVLDVEKEALLVLAHGIQACGDDHAIYSFTSRRRHRVNVRTIKTFEQAVDTATERRIGALEPGLYTRMGAAIRHVTTALAQRPNRHRLLLMLTDGKPNDTDHYEGRFAIEDTRMAVREARRQGLTVFGITIDAEARQYFPAIFGRAGYAIVARPSGLAAALPQLYRQLIR